MSDLNEIISNDQNYGENPGQYVAAFFMIIKAGDPSVRHRDDKYIRGTRFSPAGRHLAFINWQREYGPDIPTYISVLYQKPGSSDFSIHLMSAPVPGMENRIMYGSLMERTWDERDSMRKVTTRHLWDISQYGGGPATRFIVNMDGDRIDLAMRIGGGNTALASSNGPGEHQSALWKYNQDERPLNLSMAKWGPFDYLLNIPSRDEMLSGNEFRDVDFMAIRFIDMYLRGCKLTNANFTNAVINNVKFDLSELKTCNFSLKEEHCSPDMLLRDVSFNDTNLSNSRFEKRPIENCKFERAVLYGTSFKKAHFVNTSFRGADLTKADFTEVNFGGIQVDGTEKLGRTDQAGTIFRKATIPYFLIGKDWQYLDLSETRFTGTISPGQLKAKGVKLIDTHLEGADLVNANFNGADLTRANFTGADLRGADFTGANLTGTILTGAKLNNAIFTKTILASTILNKADLTGATFIEAPLFGRTVDNRTRLQEATIPMSFIGANWSYLDLTKVNLLNKNDIPANLNAAYVILDEVNLNGANLSNANLNHAQLKGTHLPNATLVEAKMNNAILIGTIFTNALMNNAELENADISNADFSGAELYGSKATLKGATAVNVSFNHSYLVKMDFSNIKGKALQGCSFSDACLVNAEFINTTLGSFNGKVTSFANSCLQGAKFNGADLKEVNLTNASIAFEEGNFQATIRSTATMQRLSFDKTAIPNDGTSRNTVCPSGDSGPCSTNQKWTAKNPRPNSWSYKGFQKKAEE